MNINNNPPNDRFGTSRNFDGDVPFGNHRFLFEELPLLPAAGNTSSSNDENAFKKKRNLRKILVRCTCRVLALTGALSYLVLGYLGVVYIKSEGLQSLVAEGVFGGVRTRVEAVHREEMLSDDDTPGENSTSAENTVVKSEDLRCRSYDEVFNETEYGPDEITVKASAVPEYEKDDAVLIIHTHGTESYYSEKGVTTNESFRSKDPQKTVVAVGSAFAEILEGRGIKTYHCTEMFDSESYIDAYARSGEAVREYLKDHPEISYVIDIHRDAVIRSDGTVVKTVANSRAQLMIVCGTDEMGADFSDWQENFAFGKEYQRMLFEKHPGIVRHMNLRSASFNQQLCERYLLLEVGTCGNTLAEATDAARVAADTFADLIKK